jgi:phospho-N-acetylmuramoyl-pentapeptide-transferase
VFYWLLYEWLYPHISPFRIFRYVTFRTAAASLTALFLCIVLGPWLIRKLKEFQIGQHIREDGPRSHQRKAGTPTMGGVLIILSTVAPTVLWADLRNPQVWVGLFGLVAFGLIGFADDYAKVRRKQNLGLTARRKFGLQVLAALLLGGMLLVLHAAGVYTTRMNVPFFKDLRPDLLINSLLDSPWTYPLAFVVFFFAFLVLVVVGAPTRSISPTGWTDWPSV